MSIGMEETVAAETGASEKVNLAASGNLKRQVTRGALVSTVSQGAMIAFRTGSMVVLARLLTPADFGLVGMVTAFTGFLGLFRDAGLSMATVQRDAITDTQTSTLFWVNLAVGGLLAALAAGAAPILAAFYSESRLIWVSIILGTSFIFNGAAAQHRALLQRRMRFTTLVTIDIVSLVLGTTAGIATALAGYGYWALVVMTVGTPGIGLIGTWLAAQWVPQWPQRRSGIRSMLLFGGTVTLNNVIVYIAYNVDKVLLGKFYGAEALGIYGRAYQLINLPTENLNSTLGFVAFPALSRVQNDPARLRSYFLKGYSLFLSVVVPITMGCALFAPDIIRVLLGSKWNEAAPLFRLMAPTILIFALINPLAWLLLASGRAERSLKIACLIAPVVILGYVLGLRSGPHGVAAGFSITMTLLVAPVVLWSKYGTLITTKDILRCIMIPSVPIVAAAAVTFACTSFLSHVEPVFVRLVVESAILFGTYAVLILFVMNQKSVCMDLLRETGLWSKKQVME